MTPHLEAALESRFRTKVQRAGGIAIKTMPTVTGWPDRLVLMPNGGVYLVELKAEGENPTSIQRHWHDLAAARGTTVVVLRGAREIDDWVRKVTQISIEAYRVKPGPRPRAQLVEEYDA